MGYKKDCPSFSNTHDSFLEDLGAHTCIDSTEGIIQQKNGPLTVEGPSQTHSLTLPSTQVDAPLANLDLKIYIIMKKIKKLKSLRERPAALCSKVTVNDKSKAVKVNALLL